MLLTWLIIYVVYILLFFYDFQPPVHETSFSSLETELSVPITMFFRYDNNSANLWSFLYFFALFSFLVVLLLIIILMIVFLGLLLFLLRKKSKDNEGVTKKSDDDFNDESYTNLDKQQKKEKKASRKQVKSTELDF